MISTVPPSTFVPADDNIFGPVVHGTTWIVLGVLAGVLGVGLAAWCLRRPAEIAAPRAPVDVPAVKAHYLSTIDGLQRQHASRTLDERELHHRLSRTVREFAADLGAPGAVAMTATLLREAGLESVAHVVAGYQAPQFSERPHSDPAHSCAVAKVAIEQW